MEQRLIWLPDAGESVWVPLGNAMRKGMPVPAGFVVFATTPEVEIRRAYEDLKIHERTHFLAVRGALHPILSVIGPDPLIHSVRRLWTESQDSALLVQRMIHSVWCGKAEWQKKNLQICVNEGMMLLDPDTYLVDSSTGQCIRRTLQPKQRKMIRHVDGTTKIVQREGERTPMTADQLKIIADLATRAGTNISWAIDDNDRAWLISIM